MLQIVKESLSGCINAMEYLAKERYYVIDTPIMYTGICKEFATLAEAEAYMNELKGKA